MSNDWVLVVWKLKNQLCSRFLYQQSLLGTAPSLRNKHSIRMEWFRMSGPVQLWSSDARLERCFRQIRTPTSWLDILCQWTGKCRLFEQYLSRAIGLNTLACPRSITWQRKEKQLCVKLSCFRFGFAKMVGVTNVVTTTELGCPLNQMCVVYQISSRKHDWILELWLFDGLERSSLLLKSDSCPESFHGLSVKFFDCTVVLFHTGEVNVDVNWILKPGKLSWLFYYSKSSAAVSLRRPIPINIHNASFCHTSHANALPF